MQFNVYDDDNDVNGDDEDDDDDLQSRWYVPVGQGFAQTAPCTHTKCFSCFSQHSNRKLDVLLDFQYYFWSQESALQCSS